MGIRPERVQEALRREISLIIQKEIKDPRLGFTTITKVEISRDLKNAKVFYSVLGSEKDENNTRHALASAEGFIKKLIGDRIKMRFVPDIKFVADRSMEHQRRVFKILDDLKKEKPDERKENDRGDKKA
jgi:ribosome-binding factor A